MRSIKALTTYLLVIFGGAVVLAPILYLESHVLARNGFKVFQTIAAYPFHRFLSRSMMVLALIGLRPFIKELGIESWNQIGLTRLNAKAVNLWFAGFLVGFSVLALAAAIAIGADARSFNFEHTMHDLLKHVRNAALAAILISVIEEIIFRGALFGALKRSEGFFVAAVLSASVYALVHFFERAQTPSHVNVFSGVVVLGHMLSGFVKFESLVPGFFNLFLVGVILALSFARTGSLYFSIGMHAAFIFWVKSYGFFTNSNPGANEWLWGGSKLINGWGPCILLLALFIFLFKTLPRKYVAQQPESIPNQPEVAAIS